MRKATVTLLAAVLAVAVTGGVAQAKGAGIGLEWGWVPTIPFNGFDMKMSNQEFTLAWELSDKFEVGVFRGAGGYSGGSEYTDNRVGENNVERALTVTGTTGVSGIRLLTGIPGLSMLKAGIEVGVLTLGAGTYRYTDSGGTGTTGDASFFPGLVVGALPAETVGLIGLATKATLISAKTRTVKTALAITASLRFADITDGFLLGQQEVKTVTPDGIDEVTHFTNLAIGINLGIWF